MNLNHFMQAGINRVMKTAGRFYLKDKEGRAFLAGMAPRLAAAARRREQREQNGAHVPAFLIASIASQCNLHCAGCYARAGGGACGGGDAQPDLTGPEWEAIFRQAADLGVSFALLAGGEPLLRRDVLDAAAKRTDMIFPVFTNGTLLDEDTLALFARHRQLIPVLSIEGDAAQTDARRGPGAYGKIEAAMDKLGQNGLLFGASVTVTRDNLDDVLSQSFLEQLRARGCGLVVYVEYVPAEQGTGHLALDEAGLRRLAEESAKMKAAFQDMILLSFPGDEEAMGGCLASGRGFFHINPKGGAEPCPFSPHAKHSLRDTPMEQVLRSGYFEQLRAIAADAGPHTGGCVLFSRENEVRALLAR